MEFTYRAYKELIYRLRNNGYEFSDYKTWMTTKRPVIFRHDIDYDIKKSVKLAEIENDVGISSTYFVLISSDFYNVFSKESYDGIISIYERGHSIGLHFDELRYPDYRGNKTFIAKKIQEEATYLSKAIGIDIDTVSMHRPSQGLLESNLEIPGIINSYNQVFFKDFKYLSDSRKKWRESLDEAIGNDNKLHILTHAFWYNEVETSIHDDISCFINDGRKRRYEWLESNISDLSSIVSEKDFMDESM